MRVLQICSKPPYPAVDGGCMAMNNITRGLMEAGVEVNILTVATHKHPLHLNQIDKEYLDNTKIKSVFLDTKVKFRDAFINLFSDKSYNIERFYSKEFEQLIASSLDQNSYDAILLEGLYVTPYISVVRRHTDAKLIYRSHNVEHQIWKRNYEQESSPIKKKYLKLLVKRLEKYELSVLNAVDAIAPITKMDKTQLEHLGAKRPMEVIPFGIDLNDNQLKESKPGIRVFHIGAMDWIPNQEGIKWFVNKVWSKLIVQHPDLQLHLAGRSMPDWMLKMNKKNVTIHGEVDNAVDFITENNIMIVPLFSGSGMRIKIIEGMACGKAIISTKIGAEGIDYNNGTDILIANTENEFVEQMNLLINTPDLIPEIGNNARKLVENYYSNTQITKQLISFINQIDADANPNQEEE